MEMARISRQGERDALMPSVKLPFPLQPNDVLLLCSDGFWNQLPHKQMVETLWNVSPLKKNIAYAGQYRRKERTILYVATISVP